MNFFPADFVPESVGYPFRADEFSHLDEVTRAKLLTLMSRISEASYRRGYQHGGLKSRVADPFILRFHVDLDLSPLTDVVGASGEWRCSNHTSADRLMMEYWVLRDLGFTA